MEILASLHEWRSWALGFFSTSAGGATCRSLPASWVSVSVLASVLASVRASVRAFDSHPSCHALTPRSALPLQAFKGLRTAVMLSLFGTLSPEGGSPLLAALRYPIVDPARPPAPIPQVRVLRKGSLISGGPLQHSVMSRWLTQRAKRQHGAHAASCGATACCTGGLAVSRAGLVHCGVASCREGGRVRVTGKVKWPQLTVQSLLSPSLFMKRESCEPATATLQRARSRDRRRAEHAWSP